MALAALQKVLKSQSDLPNKIGCKHMPGQDISYCALCQKDFREMISILVKNFQPSQFQKLPDVIKAKVVAAVIEDAFPQTVSV